ncbi:MAG TPA: TrmH family RNA methyltransferase [Actinomycetes bacterium]|nr:TrmH family RNA methyltransferase [Actinomycetes bacterium]
MAQLRGTDLKRLHRSWRRRKTHRLALLLESVQSPFNVGSIVRTAAAFGVQDLYLVGSAPVRSPNAQKTAMGTDRYLSCRDYENVAAAVAAARATGYRVIGLELADEATPLHELDLDRDICIALGHEDRGLSASALGLCDAVAYVPQLGKVGSLNVAVAAAIACYEARRQDWAAMVGPAAAVDPVAEIGPAAAVEPAATAGPAAAVERAAPVARAAPVEPDAAEQAADG